MTMTTKGSKAEALDFFFSTRGNYIMAQALHYAIEALESVEPKVMRELSNIADMKFLQEKLFTGFPSELFDVEAQKEIIKKLSQKENTYESN